MVLRGRHKIKMKLLYSNEDQVLKSPYYMDINLWNQLDEKTQSIESREEFKRKLKLMNIDTLQLGGRHLATLYPHPYRGLMFWKYMRVKLLFIQCDISFGIIFHIYCGSMGPFLVDFSPEQASNVIYHVSLYILYIVCILCVYIVVLLHVVFGRTLPLWREDLIIILKKKKNVHL